MDYDDVHSDREQSPEPRQDLLDDDVEDQWQHGLGQRERSTTPVYDADPLSLKTKPRKRLIKKGENTGAKEIVVPSLVDEDEDDEGFERHRKKRKESGGGSSGKKEKRHKGERRGFSSGKGESNNFSKRGFSSGKDRDGEVKEMWDTIAGDNSEVY